MNINNKIKFIKRHIRATHTQQDFEDLKSFNDKEINRIYNEIVEDSLPSRTKQLKLFINSLN